MDRLLERSLLFGALGLGAAAALRTALIARRYFPLHDRVALITGGSRGLGLVLARQLIDRGCRVAICSRDEAELDDARQQLTARANYAAARIVAIPCDVTDPRAVSELFRRVRGQLGEIDILINDAGIISMAPEQDMTADDYEAAMRIHFWGPLHTMRQALPSMRARRSGRIANISSIGGKVPVPHLAPYCASKFALTGLSSALRTEAAADNVYISTICPGLMRTGSHVNATFKGDTRREYAWFKWAGLFGSMSAERAAARIIRAIQIGEADVVIGFTALAAARLYALAPECASDAISLGNRLLPSPTGRRGRYAKGREAESRRTQSRLMAPMDRATIRNNEEPNLSPTTEDTRALET